jgi:hypothetical protein
MYYFFTSDKLPDGRPIPAIGDWLGCMCGSSHTCKHPFDALGFAPGPLLHKVELDTDQLKIVVSVNTTELLREFARWCALQVIDKWRAPNVVLEYLETGNPSLREEAREAALATSSGEAWATEAATWPPDNMDGIHAVYMARAAAEYAVHTAAAAAVPQRTKFQGMVDKAFGN